MVASTYVVTQEAAGVPAAALAQGPAPGQYGGSQQAVWYPDPQGQARLRYWDGRAWTEHTSA